MSIQYILGSSGSGKTTFCLNEMLEQAENSNKNIIFLVPEQFTMESEKKLVSVSVSQKGAVINPQVLSFQRLAYHLFAKTGANQGKHLEDIGKNMLLRKIILSLRKDLDFYKKNLDKQGFIDNLASLIKEFSKYGVDANSLGNYLLKIKKEEMLYFKIQDLQKIYEKYTEIINENYITAETILEFVPERLKESEYLKDTEVWIDGFSGFTPQEYKIIETIIKTSLGLKIALISKTKDSFYPNLKETDIFHETKNTINRITELGKNNNREIKEVIFLEKNPRFKNFEEMAFFEKKFLIYNKNNYQKETKNIEISVYKNIYEEIEETAIKIIEKVRSNNYRFKDIAIVSGDFSSYERVIRNVFKKYDIPVFLDTKPDITAHPLTELIRSSIDVLAYNKSYESIFRFLKTNLTSLDKEEIDLLENYVLAYGIKANKWDVKEWTYGYQDEPKQLEKINDYKNKTLCFLEPLIKNMTENKKLTIKEFSIRIFEMLRNLNIVEKLENLEKENGNAEIAKEHFRIYEKICEVFEKVIEILADEKVTAKEFSQIIEDGFKKADFGVIPPSNDLVIFADTERSRLPDIKLLFLVGVNEGKFPSEKIETNLLLEDERVLLSKLGMELSPTSRQVSLNEQFVLYSLITKAENKLFISYATSTIEGKSLKPSVLIKKMFSLFPSLEEKETLNKDIITLAKPMFSKVSEVLNAFKKEENINIFEKNVYYWYSNNRDFSLKIEHSEKLAFEVSKEVYLGKKHSSKLYPSEIHSDISRIEKYTRCPFAYYIEHNLRVKERKIYEVRSTDYGNFFHNVLEDFSKRLYFEKIEWKDLDSKQIDTFVEDAVFDLAQQPKNSIFKESAKYQYALRKISRISKKSIETLAKHIKSGNFKPVASEASFGNDTAITGITININDTQKFILKGRIDRIDIMDFDGSRYVKIIDYKSGDTAFDISDLYFGMQLQLVMYLNAIIENANEIFDKENIETKILPGGVFYFNIKDPIESYDGNPNPEIVEDKIYKNFKMSGLVLKDENIIKAMDKNVSPGKKNRFSKIIPVEFVGNEIKEDASVVTKENFEKIQELVKTRIKEIGSEMVNGNINIYPFKKINKNNITSCNYCRYSGICQIDILEDKGKYNIVKLIKTLFPE